jgi:excinuclease ABC subunit C
MIKNFKEVDVSKINKLPSNIGLYVFFGKNKKILYIGKASNIKVRVKSHFAKNSFRDSLFLEKVRKVGFKKTASEIEALILEMQLIKKYQPQFNVIWKDDKNYFYVGITKEDFPRIFLTHQTTLQDSEPKTVYIGPFVDGKAIKQTLRILRKIFPYRSCKTIPKHPCMWYQLGLCPGPCKIKIENRNPKNETYLKVKKECQKNVKAILKILTGKRLNLIKELKKEMLQFSKQQEYEKAAETRDKIYALENILSHTRIFFPQTSPAKPWRSPLFCGSWEEIEQELKKIISEEKSAQKIKKIVRIEGYDISNIQGKEAVGAMVVFENGKPSKKDYRKFKVKIEGKPNDTAMLKEVIERRLRHKEWELPDLIFVDGGKAQLNAARSALGGKKIKLMALAKRKNELFIEGKRNPLLLKELPREISNLILQIRDEAHRFAVSYHRKLRRKKLTKAAERV